MVSYGSWSWCWSFQTLEDVLHSHPCQVKHLASLLGSTIYSLSLSKVIESSQQSFPSEGYLVGGAYGSKIGKGTLSPRRQFVNKYFSLHKINQPRQKIEGEGQEVTNTCTRMQQALAAKWMLCVIHTRQKSTCYYVCLCC